MLPELTPKLQYEPHQASLTKRYKHTITKYALELTKKFQSIIWPADPFKHVHSADTLRMNAHGNNQTNKNWRGQHEHTHFWQKENITEEKVFGSFRTPFSSISASTFIWESVSPWKN